MDVDFSLYYSSVDIDYLWSSLKGIINDSITLYVPKVKRPSYKYPRWFTGEIKHHLHQLRSLRRKWRSSGDHPLHLSKVRSLEFSLQEEITTARSRFEAALVHKFAFSNDNAIFKYIHGLLKSNALPNTVTFGGESATSDVDKAHLFNTFFHSVFSSDVSSPPFSSLSEPALSLDAIDITVQDVYSALISLDPSKTTGIDGIPARLLKFCATPLCSPIHHLFTQCFEQSYLPLEWRTHMITPIHKSGDKRNVTNYRPISLVCCISKVLEKIIFDKIAEFIQLHFISSQQFSFLKGRSTLQQLVAYLSTILVSFSESCQTDVIFLDIRKAFDTVSHSLLLEKVWNAGITGSTWEFLRAYLSSRLQCVSINNCKSALLPVLSGVPQGSLLGPLLFIIYINDLPLMAKFSSLFLFANDSKCSKSVRSATDSDQLQQDLNNIHEWSLSSNLVFNFKKSSLVTFCPARRTPLDFSYHLNGQSIPRTHSVRDLGVLFSSDLSWGEHIRSIASRGYQTIGLLRRAFPASTPVRTKKLLFLSLVLPKLTYCSPIWRPNLIKDILLLESVQRRATKFILNDYSSDYKTRLTSLKLLPLMYRLELNDIMFFVSSLRNPSPHFDISDYFSFCNHSISTRSSTSFKLQHSLPPSSQLRHSFFHRLPIL